MNTRILMTAVAAGVLTTTACAESAVARKMKAPESDANSMVWGWCEEPDMSGPFPVGWYCTSVIGFPDNMATKFAGCEVKSVFVAKGYFEEENPVIDIFLANGKVSEENGYPELLLDDPFIDMKDVPFPGAQYEWVEIELPEPYEITEGAGFYIGWGYANINENNCPLMSDMVINDNLDTSWMGCSSDDPEMFIPMNYWNNCNSAGANCIRISIEGENLPSDDLVITDIEAPRYLPTGENADITLTITNAASKTIENCDIEYGFAGDETKAATITGLSVGPRKLGKIVLEGIGTKKEGNLLFEVNIVKVNGRADADGSNNMISAPMLSLSDGNGFSRNVVVEEGTGTWCQNCPRGIVGMRRMSEKYPERFIGIAMHNNDEMAIEAYKPILDRYITVGYPYSTMNRAIGQDPNFDSLEADFQKESEIPAIVDIQCHDMQVIGNMMFVNSEATFAAGEDAADYGWAFVITEDNVGPYWQANAYTSGNLEGWDFSESYVRIEFDEVARGAKHILGMQGSIPSSTIAGEKYSMPMTIEADNISDITKTHLIVMLINRKTGYIENARKFSYDMMTSAKTPEAQTHLSIIDGTATLLTGDKASIHTIEGILKAELAQGESVTLEKGTYVVSVDGRTYKTIVK